MRHVGLVVGLCACTVACGGGAMDDGGDDDDPPPVAAHTDVFLPFTTLPAGVVAQATAEHTDVDGITTDVTDTVTWASSATGVATVDSRGVITALGVGDTVITATVGSVTGEVAVTVSDAVLEDLTVVPALYNVPLDVPTRVHAIGQFSDGSFHDLTSLVTWEVSPASATVELVGADAVVTASQPTTFDLTAELDTISGFQVVYVDTSELYTLTIELAAGSSSCDGSTLPVGVDLQYRALGEFGSGNEYDITHLATWSSSNSSVASVGTSSPGIVTAADVGTATITATIGLVTDDISIAVGNASLSNVEVQTSPITDTATSHAAPLGVMSQFHLIGTFSDGCTRDITNAATWSSSNTGVASVSSGRLQPLVAGSVDVLTELPNFSQPIGVDVVEPPSGSREHAVTATFSNGVSACGNADDFTTSLNIAIAGGQITIIQPDTHDVSTGWIAPDGTFFVRRFDGLEMYAGQLDATGAGTAFNRYIGRDNCGIDHDVTFTAK